jgi:hypothetical protein
VYTDDALSGMELPTPEMPKRHEQAEAINLGKPAWRINMPASSPNMLRALLNGNRVSLSSRPV